MTGTNDAVMRRLGLRGLRLARKKSLFYLQLVVRDGGTTEGR